MSEIPKLDKKDWISEADLLKAAGFVDERSKRGSSQQLKSPPRMRECELRSGKEEKKHSKNPVSSMFGA